MISTSNIERHFHVFRYYVAIISRENAAHTSNTHSVILSSAGSRKLSYIVTERRFCLAGHVFTGVASYGALGHVLPRHPTISFLAQFGVNMTANYSSIVYSPRDQLVQMSTTHSSFDQYCISHKTISHRAAAAPGPEVHREGPIT